MAGGLAATVFICVVPLAAFLVSIGTALHDIRRNDLAGLLAFAAFFVVRIAIVVTSVRVFRKTGAALALYCSAPLWPY